MNTPCRFFLLGGFVMAWLAGCSTSYQAPQLAYPSDLPVILGTSEICRVSASDTVSNKATNQQIRLVVSDPLSVSYADLRSGKSRTLPELISFVSTAFGRYLNDNLASGTLISTLGAAQYGGEARFVAMGDMLQIDYGGVSPTVSFSREEVAALKGILDQALRG